jgi:DNA-binding transcriptional ArsR family regulator
LSPITKREKRSIEEAVSYGIGHPIRIDILCILNEGTRSPSELSKLIRQPLTTVGHHIKELSASGCIEIARVEKARNADQHFYRAVKLPIVTDEEAEALPPEVRHEYAALILQAIAAEGLAALSAGKLDHDPTARLMWDWYNLDAQGQQELADEQNESWARGVEIAARSANRMAKSGEEPVTVIASTLGFRRSRPGGAQAPLARRLPPGKH